MDNNRKNNVVVLTIVALVTLILIVVGATYAYLATQLDTSNESNVNATTSGSSDLFLINVGDDLSVTANETNFLEGDGDITDDTFADVSLQTSAVSNTSHSYTVSLVDITNNFEYTSGTCYKNSGATDLTSTYADYDACTEASNFWTSDGKCLSGLTESRPNSSNEAACTNISTNVWAENHVSELSLALYKASNKLQAACNGVGIWEDDKCFELQDTFDVTEETEDTLLGTYTITANGDNPAHDYFMATLTLVNLDHNQLGNAQKTFSAQLRFVRTTNDD